MRALLPTGSAARWLIVVLYVNAILWTIPYQRVWSDSLVAAGYGRWWVGLSGVAFAVAGIVAAAVRGGIRRDRIGALGLCAAVYAAIVWYLSPVPEEVIHLAEYGAMAVLVWWALVPAGLAGAAWMAAATAGTIGFADEIIQGATPGRFFDWRDVGVNLLAALLPAILLTIVSKRGGED